MKLKDKNSGFALIISLMVAFFLSLLFVAAYMRSEMQLNSSNALIASQLAFNAAEAGIEQTVYQLKTNPKYLPNDTTPQVIPISGNASSVQSYQRQSKVTAKYFNFNADWVLSVGTGIFKGKTAYRCILAKLVIINPGQFFVTTQGELNIGSGSNINSDIFGKDVNFNTFPGDTKQQITVGGNVYYSNSVNGLTPPEVSLAPGKSTIQLSTESFVGVDTTSYSDLAQKGGDYVTGDLIVDSSNINSLPTGNQLVYATGNIYISGELQNPTLFVAQGNIYITNSLTTSSTAQGALGLMANQSVIVSSNATDDPMNIDAYVVAAGGANSQRQADPLGGVFMSQGTTQSKGALNFTGSIAVQSSTNSSSVDLNVYRTRNYNYLANTSVPYVSYAVNIINWQEVPPQSSLPAS